MTPARESGAAAGPRPLGFVFVEALAVAVTIACVWFTAREHILCWPLGILGAALYIYVFAVARLYSDVLLQVYFLVTSVWGWYEWLYGGAEATPLAVSRLSARQAVACFALVAVGAAGLGRLMKRRTRAALPYVDAATTVLSLVAQALLARKILENWVLWIAADVVDVGVYLRRRLYLTALLYVVLLGIAIMGLIEWTGKL